MRKINAIVDLERTPTSKTERGAGKIAKAIDGKTGRFLKAGYKERRSQMGEMMFDMMDLRLKLDPIPRFQRFLDRRRAADVFDFLPHQFRMGPVSEHKTESPPIVHTGLTIDRDVIEVA